MPKKNGLKPWAEVWQTIIDLRFVNLDDAELTPNEEGWITVRCPFHNDESPSFRVNLETGSVKCMSHDCAAKRDITNLNQLELAATDTDIRHSSKPRDPVGDLANRRKLPKEYLVDRWGLEITPGGYTMRGNDPFVDTSLEAPEEEGMDDEARRQHRKKHRTNYRYFKRGAYIDPENTRWPKYAWKPALKKTKVKAQDLVYNLDAVRGDQVMIAAGPPDVWVLEYAGFNAISFLAGESGPPSSRAVNRVYEHGVREATIIYDVDEAGREGADKVAVALSKHGIECVVLELPETLGEKADITDLWVHCDGDKDTFMTALEHCESRKWTADVRVEMAHAHPPAEPIRLPEFCWVEPFDAYREALAQSTEACDEYHFFSLLNVIGALFGRRVYTYYARKLYPNQYTCLVGPTGMARKSTAMGFALNVIEYIEQMVGRNRSAFESKLRRTEASGSAEGLMEAMAFADIDDPEEIEVTRAAMGQRKGKNEDGSSVTEEYLLDKQQRRLLIVQDEFTQLLAKAKAGAKGGGGTMIPHLLRAYDAPSEIRLPTRHHPLVIVNPIVSILSGSTSEFLSKFFDEDEWYSGFGNRILFVEGTPKATIPQPKEPDDKELEFVVTYLRETFERYASLGYNIKFELTDEATAYWAERYEAWMGGRGEYNEDKLAGTQRVPEYAMKVALLIAALERDQDFKNGKFVIADLHVHIGWAVAGLAEQAALRLVEQLAVERIAVYEQRLIAFLAEKGEADKRTLRQRFSRLSSETFNRLLDNMEKSESIEQNAAGNFILVG
jgi:hypothetical protein